MRIPDEKITEVMNEVINRFLIPKFIELGMNASGKWLETLHGAGENGIGYIRGMDYTRYLANGRAPGKMPPIEPLVQWVGHKFGYYGNEARSVAYAVAKKIQREGTDYYPQGTDLVDILNSAEVRQFVYGQFAGFVRLQIATDIKRMLNETLIHA